MHFDKVKYHCASYFCLQITILLLPMDIQVIAEEDIPVGAHYRARTDMLDNVSISSLFLFKLKFTML